MFLPQYCTEGQRRRAFRWSETRIRQGELKRIDPSLALGRRVHACRLYHVSESKMQRN
jgi:hypothetical protein